MDDLATARVLRTATREVDRLKSPANRGPGKVGRMVRVAEKLEQALRRNNALPTRNSDHCLIGDLAELELRVTRLNRALRAVIATPRARVGREPFEHRLVQLAAEVDATRAVLRDLRGPMGRLMKQRCGNVGLAVAALVGATGVLE
jgi:hypothetical protein